MHNTKEKRRAYDLKNREHIKMMKKLWKEKNREKHLEHKRKSYEKNKVAHNEYMKKYVVNRRKVDPNFRIMHNLRRRLSHALKGSLKSDSTLNLLGCTTEELKMRLESLWIDGMSWDTYGVHGWHIDHIKPCVEFDLTDPEQQKQCFHYTNLQPLWWKDNLDKR